jgi:metallo-beta-lactamase class B
MTVVAAPATAKATDGQAQGKALAAACRDRNGWADPAPPARIFGDTYYVGTCGITVLLIASRRWGHTLIDSGPAEAAPLVLANIRKLGFRPRDVKLIVGSHEHIDHMGGMAALKAATGAQLWLRAPAKAMIESGRIDPSDPQAGSIPDVPAVKVESELTETGPIQLRSRDEGFLNIVATPGHTSGGTSYYWTECDRTRCLTLAYVDSLSAISRDGYRFTDHPERVAPYRTTFARVADMKCDVLITPHPGLSNLFTRLAGAAPLVDRAGCRRLAESAGTALEKRLASEGTATAH